MTNLHVVDGARAIKVSLPDGRRFEKVTARTFDVNRDVVVLHLETARDEKPLPSMELGVASSLQPGDSILVISNPLGLESTVTDGIVSAWRPARKDEADTVEEWDDGLILVTSDHGNMEDLSTRRHTDVPVPALVIGDKAARE